MGEKTNMKKVLGILLALFLLCAVLPALADTQSGNFTYTLLEDGTASITGCTAAGDIVIPGTIDGYTVTNLKAKLFYSKNGITSVTVPKSVTYLGPEPGASEWAYTFSYCWELQNIYVESGSQSFVSDNGVLYNKTKTILVNYPVMHAGAEYHVPTSVAYLACTSFAANENLRDLYLDSANTYWMTYTFYNCPNLRVHYYPGGKTEQWVEKFTANGLAGAENGYPTFIPMEADPTAAPSDEPTATPSAEPPADPIAEPPADPTAEPTNDPTDDPDDEPDDEVDEVTVQNGYYALYDNGTATLICADSDALTRLVIPATVSANGRTYKVTEIDEDACGGMKKLTMLIIGKNVKTIGKRAFDGCVKLKTVKGAAAVTSIKDSAFSGCKALKTFPALKKLTSIGASAFKNCVKLTGFTLGEKVKSIGKNAFYGCKALKTVTVKTVKLTGSSVKANAFKGIYARATFKCPSGMKKTYKKLFVKKGAPSTCKFK